MQNIKITSDNFHKGFWLITLFFFLQVTALHPLIRNTPATFYAFTITLYFILVAMVYGLFFYYQKFQSYCLYLMGNYQLLILFFLGLLVIGIVLYQHELYLQTLSHRGNDESDMFTVSTKAFIHGQLPYQKHVYSGNPVTVGLGWLFLALPFTLTKLYILMTPAYLISIFFLIKKWHSLRQAFLFLLMLSSSITFWELFGDGSDMIALGSAFTLATLLIYHYWGKNLWSNIGLIIFVGLLGTARVNFFYIGPLLGLLLFSRSRIQGTIFGIVSFTVTLILQITLYLQVRYNRPGTTILNHGPFYLLSIAKAALPLYLLIPSLLICLIVGIYILISKHQDLSSWFRSFWLALIAPLFFVSVGELAFYKHWLLMHWNSANDIAVTTPLLVAWFVSNLSINKT